MNTPSPRRALAPLRRAAARAAYSTGAGAETWAQLWGEGIPPPYGTYPSWNVRAEWWWGLTRSAVEAMVTTDSNWRIKEVVQVPWNGASDDLFVIAERVSQ